MWGISRGFILIQDGGDYSRIDLWVHFGTLEQTQVLTGSCGIGFIVIQTNTSINLGHGFKNGKHFNIEMLMIFCFAAP